MKCSRVIPLQFTMHGAIECPWTPSKLIVHYGGEDKRLLDGSSHVIDALQGVWVVKESWMINGTYKVYNSLGM